MFPLKNLACKGLNLTNSIDHYWQKPHANKTNYTLFKSVWYVPPPKSMTDATWVHTGCMWSSFAPLCAKVKTARNASITWNENYAINIKFSAQKIKADLRQTLF